jgi:hypothetical protein
VEDLGVGEAGVAVDRGVDVDVPTLAAAPCLSDPAVRSPAAAGRDPSVFVMSTWTSSPGRVISIRRIRARVGGPYRRGGYGRGGLAPYGPWALGGP